MSGRSAPSRRAAALSLLIAVSLAGCRPESQKPGASTGTPPGTSGAPGGDAGGSRPGGTNTKGGTPGPRAGSGLRTPEGPTQDKTPAPPAEPKLPDAPPYTKAAARAALTAAVDPAGEPEFATAAVASLADAGDPEEVRAAAAKLLVRGDGPGGWDDVSLAAAAFAALLAIGDADAAGKIVALGRDAADADESGVDLVHALAAVAAKEGAPQAADARKLLVRLTENDFDYEEALGALAEVRGAEGRQRFFEVANDAEESPSVRASAAAGLLAIGDVRGAEILGKLTDESGEPVASSEVIDGLGVRGVGEGVETIKKLVRAGIDEDNSALEVRSAAAALVEIRGAGKGTPEDMAFLRGLLGTDDGLMDEHVHVALWALGDATSAAPTAKALVRWMLPTSAWFDAEEAVWVLELVAERREGASEAFNRVVDAAAAIPVPEDQARPDRAVGARRIRLAAAHARLR